MPDVVVQIGDFFDLPSLSSHDAPGSREAEGRRVKPDIDVGNEAWERLFAPMHAEIARRKRRHLKRWEPRLVWTMGNHENRLERAISRDPKWDGLLTLDALQTPGFERHKFLEIVDIDGIAYSHYFAGVHSGRPIGGSVENRLNAVGRSFCQGHEQGLRYARKPYPGNLARHGLVAGSFYLHTESYRGPQGEDEWRGIVVLNEVHDGQYDVMPLSMSYLRRRFS